MTEYYDIIVYNDKNIYLTYTENDLISNILLKTSKELTIPNNLLKLKLNIECYNYNIFKYDNMKYNQLKYNSILEEFKYPWLSTLFLSINNILLYLRPTMTILLNQKNILDYIIKILYKCLGTIAFPTGVTITHVLLPNEKIDMTVFLPNPVDHKWQLKFHEALIPENPTDPVPNLNSIQFHNKDKSASLVFGDVKVNISVNDISALYNSSLYEDLDEVFDGDGLMKNSYLLIKAWIINDSEDTSG